MSKGNVIDVCELWLNETCWTLTTESPCIKPTLRIYYSLIIAFKIMLDYSFFHLNLDFLT